MHPQAAVLKALLDEPRLQIMPGCGDGNRVASGSTCPLICGKRWRSTQFGFNGDRAASL